MPIPIINMVRDGLRSLLYKIRFLIEYILNPINHYSVRMLTMYCKCNIQHFKNLLVLLGGHSGSLALLFIEISGKLLGLPKSMFPHWLSWNKDTHTCFYVVGVFFTPSETHLLYMVQWSFRVAWLSIISSRVIKTVSNSPRCSYIACLIKNPVVIEKFIAVVHGVQNFSSFQYIVSQQDIS